MRPAVRTVLIVLAVVFAIMAIVFLALFYPANNGHSSGTAEAATRSGQKYAFAAKMCRQANDGKKCPASLVDEIAKALVDGPQHTKGGTSPLANLSKKRHQRCKSGWSKDWYNNMIGKRLFDATLSRAFCYNGKKITWISKPILRVHITTLGSVLWSEVGRHVQDTWMDPHHKGRVAEADVTMRACKKIIWEVCVKDATLEMALKVYRDGTIWPPKPNV